MRGAWSPESGTNLASRVYSCATCCQIRSACAGRRGHVCLSTACSTGAAASRVSISGACSHSSSSGSRREKCRTDANPMAYAHTAALCNRWHAQSAHILTKETDYRAGNGYD